MDASCMKNDPSFSGGLEETYTDFETWITRWKCKFKHRPTIKEQSTNKIADASEQKIALQELLVYGFITSNRILAPKEIVLRLGLGHTEDFVHLDYVLMKLLNDNDSCRSLNTNKSKL